MLSMASGITRELLAKIVSPEDALARKNGREMLRAAFCRMWNERLASNLVEARSYHSNGSPTTTSRPAIMPPPDEKSKGSNQPKTNGSPTTTGQLGLSLPDKKSNGSTQPPFATPPPPAQKTTPQPAPPNSYAGVVKAAYIPPHMKPRAAIVPPT
ncbi:hypothetical protein LTR17_009226 [Elasticomyces elasticus]|nr:hypothetical protein LTR17_009226 [Elasticomyces elasticus]